MTENAGIWGFFLRNYKFTFVTIATFLLLGLLSVWFLPKESDPDVNIPIVVVVTSFPGANALDVEQLVTNPLEEKLLSLSSAEEVSSESKPGLSVITIQFDIKGDPLEMLTDVKDKIDQAKPDLPSEVNEPLVNKVNVSDTPILTLSLTGPYSVSDLTEYADILADELEKVSGVSEVNLVGGLDREVQVLVDRAKLDNFSLSINDVTRAISLANSNIPIGSIETSGEVYSVRFAGQIESASELAFIPIVNLGGSPVLVRDVAEVIDGREEASTLSRLSIAGEPSASAVSLQIKKVVGGDILRIVNSVDRIVASVLSERLPVDLAIARTEDNAQFIKDDLYSLSFNGLGTVIIVFLILLFFLGWREAILAGLSIPLTFLITFFFLYQFGFTINFLSLFSLILALGILVDSSIVITESLHIELVKGSTPLQAALKTVRYYQLPLISGTLTTVFAFLPMMLMSGIMGEYIKSIPVTVTIVLLSSIFVALAVVTTLGMFWLRRSDTDSDQPHAEAGFITTKLRPLYLKFLNSILVSRSRQRQLYTLLILGFVFSLSLPALGILKVNMFPAPDIDFFNFSLEKPIGTPLSVTSQSVEPLEAILLSDQRIKSFLVRVGEGGSHLANLTVILNKNRDKITPAIVSEYRQKLAELNTPYDTVIRVAQLGMGPPSGAPVEIKVIGDSLDTIDSIGEQIMNILSSISGAVDIKSSTELSNGEFALYIDRAKASLYGVNASTVAGLLRNSVSGTEATDFRENQSDIPVVVKYRLDPIATSPDKSDLVDITNLQSLTIGTPAGEVPLSAFLSVQLEAGRNVINHLDGERIVKVTADTSGVTAQEIFTAVSNSLNSLNIPEGYTVKMGGENEDVQESFADMFQAMFLAIFLIGALLVWQFGSFRQSFFILLTIPLALTGVFPGLSLLHQPLSFPAVIGIVALAGIVVNNAIILIDRINAARLEENMSISKAVEEAASSRLQPILLTTITTVAGILPLTLSDLTWGPLGFSIIFGLLFSTILTLLVIPVLYNRFAK